MWSEAIHTVLSPTPPWVPRPGFGPEAGLGVDWGHALDTLVHTIQGAGHHCPHPLGRSRAWPSFLPGTRWSNNPLLAHPHSVWLRAQFLAVELGTVLCCYHLGAKAVPVLLGAILGCVCHRTSLPLPFWLGQLLSRQTKPTEAALLYASPVGNLEDASPWLEQTRRPVAHGLPSWSPNTTWRSRPSPSNSNSKGDAPHPAHLWGPALLPGPVMTILFPNPSGSNQAKMFGKVGLAPTPSWGRERPLDFQSGSRPPETRKDDGSQESKSCNGKEVCGIRTSHGNLAPPPARCPSALRHRTSEHMSGVET